MSLALLQALITELTDAQKSDDAWKPDVASAPKSTFAPDLDFDSGLEALSVSESLCVRCEEQGQTRMLTVNIPYFKELILISFHCPHCGFSNNEVETAAEIAERGSEITLRVNADDAARTRKDLNRQIIRSEHCRLLLPSIEFEGMPAKRGSVNTLEGVLTTIADGLQDTYITNPPEGMTPDLLLKFVTLVAKVRSYAQGDDSFELVLDDPSGNSFIENPDAPKADPGVTIKYYDRTREQAEAMGYRWEEEQVQSGVDQGHGAQVSEEARLALESYTKKDHLEHQADIPGVCHACHQENITRMCMIDIPHFKEVLVMSTQCEHCGYKDSEVKPGGAVSPLGVLVTLKVTHPKDLARDLLKSDSAGVRIPELELELGYGTLGGKYTTLEGLLNDIRAQLTQANVFQLGDSSTGEDKTRMGQFIRQFERVAACKVPWTLILDDPLGNVFIHNPHYPNADPNMLVETYERTQEMNDDLGLSDMNTDTYNEWAEAHAEPLPEHPQAGVIEQSLGNIDVVDHPHHYTPPETIFSQEKKAAAEASLEKKSEH